MALDKSVVNLFANQFVDTLHNERQQLLLHHHLHSFYSLTIRFSMQGYYDFLIEKISMNFIMATDYLYESRDINKREAITYLGIYTPYLRPYSNPFAKLG